MGISKKPKTPSSFIAEGGTPADSKDEIALVQLRISRSFLKKIDLLLESKTVKPKRHAWLLEAIAEKYDSEINEG